MSTPMLEFVEVSKRLDEFALEKLSFALQAGQIMGFVGPNGAGKSTSLRILMGLMAADSGDVRVLGYTMPREQVQAKAEIAYVCDDMRLLSNQNLGWHMAFMRSIYPSWDEPYAQQLLKRFGLRAGRICKGLSSGEHVRALLLLALARRPKLMVLDEPTAGLDPVARHEVLSELMDALGDESRSIIFSSHNTLDIEQISDQITFIDRGKIVASDDKESFLERWRRVLFELAPERALPVLPGMVEPKRAGTSASVLLQNFEPAQLTLLQAAGAIVRDVQHLRLEEIFVAQVLHQRAQLEQGAFA